MPLSCRILRGVESNGGFRVLELRHQFVPEALEEDLGIARMEAPEVNPGLEAGRIVAEAEEKARTIISDAREAARVLEERIIQEALEEAEKIKERAREEAFEQGKKEALAKAAADASSIRDQARSVLRQAEEIRRQTLESVEADIVRLAIEIAEKVLAVKLKLHPQVVVDVAKEAINMLHDRDQVVLYVNPAEAELYESKREELMKHLSPRGELHIIADHGVGPGGCVAETEFGRVDARLGTRWEALLKNLEEIGR
ncbi:MAG: flagellar biosynthesis protein [Peptococcaceae bacterium]|nr:flagellar biosynthesis protein [Peptococcaceae bacterium]